MPSALIIITTDFGKQDTWTIACKVKSSGKATPTMNTHSQCRLKLPSSPLCSTEKLGVR